MVSSFTTFSPYHLSMYTVICVCIWLCVVCYLDFPESLHVFEKRLMLFFLLLSHGPLHSVLSPQRCAVILSASHTHKHTHAVVGRACSSWVLSSVKLIISYQTEQIQSSLGWAQGLVECCFQHSVRVTMAPCVLIKPISALLSPLRAKRITIILSNELEICFQSFKWNFRPSFGV